jgi:hypothetical protein
VIAVGLIKKSAVAVLLAVGLLLVSVCTAAFGAEAERPEWRIMSVAGPSHFKPGDTEDILSVMAVNVGGKATDGSTVTITDTLPAGLTATSVEGYDIYKGLGLGVPKFLSPLSCEGTSVVSCNETVPVDGGNTLYVEIHVSEIGSGLPGALVNEAGVAGGGAPTASEQTTIPVDSVAPSFGFAEGSVISSLSSLQAGAHPDITAVLALSRSGPYTPVEDAKDIRFDAPVGFVGNTVGVPRCSMAKVAELFFSPCPRDSMVGMATIMVQLQRGNFDVPITSPIYNIAPAPGEPAAFAFDPVVFPVRLDTSVKSDGNYGVTVTAPDVTEGAELVYSAITIWGVPADHSGTGSEDQTLMLFSSGDPHFGGPGTNTRVALTANPTQCSTPLTGTMSIDKWTDQGVFVSQTVPSGTLTGCDHVPFGASISMLPDTLQAGAPAGYNFALRVPRVEDTQPDSVAAADVKKTVVTLPAGTVISPSIADGLAVCRDDAGVDPGAAPNEFGMHSLTPASCAQGAQVGTVQISSPLIAKPLDGQVYLATPECEPCTPQDAEDGKMVKLLLQARGEGSNGVIVKVAGSLSVNQQNGQLTATFDNTPQLPFDELKLSLGGGPRAALANPRTCGPATTSMSLTPWTEPFVPSLQRSYSFEVTGCYAPQFNPYFMAGTTSNQAGGYSPFTVSFGRKDADEFLAGLKMQMPPGVLGMLSSVSLCGEPQASRGTCSADSQIGHVQVLTGPGAEPFLVTDGKIYITGPYKGAPYGLSIVVPAKAGPYTIAGPNGTGTVVVRAAVNVDPHTAALTVASDPLPTVLDGIPLQLKRVDVSIDKPGFVFNPTTCNKLAIGATLTSAEGASANGSSSFQVTNCGGLRFKPAFKVSTNGKTSRADGASLTARLSYPTNAAGTQANISKVKVSLPKQLPSRLATLQKACPAETFDTNPAACPEASKIGSATANTPVIPVPLTGPVYFVSHGGQAFPDLIVVLQGYGVTVDLIGNTFISKGITSTTFNTVPDVPIGSFELKLPQGTNSALAANGNLCNSSLKMPTIFTAQDGTTIKQTTPISTTGCAKHKPHHHKKKHRKHKKK